jgi:small subunit ribosomal protein S4
VNHRHILVNGRWVNIPSLHLKENDVMSIKPKSRQLPCFITAAEEMINLPPAYIERSIEDWSARLLYYPEREEVPISCDVPLVIEYYSRWHQFGE